MNLSWILGAAATDVNTTGGAVALVVRTPVDEFLQGAVNIGGEYGVSTTVGIEFEVWSSPVDVAVSPAGTGVELELVVGSTATAEVELEDGSSIVKVGIPVVGGGTTMLVEEIADEDVAGTELGDWDDMTQFVSSAINSDAILGSTDSTQERQDWTAAGPAAFAIWQTQEASLPQLSAGTAQLHWVLQNGSWRFASPTWWRFENFRRAEGKEAETTAANKRMSLVLMSVHEVNTESLNIFKDRSEWKVARRAEGKFQVVVESNEGDGSWGRQEQNIWRANNTFEISSFRKKNWCRYCTCFIKL
jgi:hypothetical protein